MDLTQLEMFNAVALTGSITQAAAKVHRVPSNLTTRIRQLEADLGVSLFIRENQRLRLSPAGHNFLRYSQQILALVDEARMVVAGEEPQGLFSLGALESTAAVRIPALLAGYNQRYPKIQFALTTGPSGAMLDGVLEGKLNAAFIDGPLMHPGLEGIPAYQEEMMIVAPHGHSVVSRASEVNGYNIYAFRANCSTAFRKLVSCRWRDPRYDSRNGVISWNVGMRNCRRRYCADASKYAQQYARTSSGGSLAVGGEVALA